ncbi:NAD(P)H oxidoreductase [Chitinophaga alhagiae]|uniref:NAD(P)H oxidoreductase n=1 Tax=Chitinophaga alhagiae TaxID=2203219 RepID=A0ABN5LN49_9BACT|nr:NAD(P)H-dependent oxidoreductase [Chitinophaga alhagiae]AWO00796.1 NAD(P)H oxidoreductase [Chitinophaga alhagiae]
MKILVLFAHPAFERSRIHVRLLQAAATVQDVTIRDLYQVYPDFDVSPQAEQPIVEQHDVIIFQHPFYWYSGPALIKQWMDLVLEHGWAYGKNGTRLQGKRMMNVLSMAGNEQAYSAQGHHGHPVNAFLLPFEQTARLCYMQYLPPFTVHSSNALSDQQLNEHANRYIQLLEQLKTNAAALISNPPPNPSGLS